MIALDPRYYDVLPATDRSGIREDVLQTKFEIKPPRLELEIHYDDLIMNQDVYEYDQPSFADGVLNFRAALGLFGSPWDA